MIHLDNQQEIHLKRLNVFMQRLDKISPHEIELLNKWIEELIFEFESCIYTTEDGLESAEIARQSSIRFLKSIPRRLESETIEETYEFIKEDLKTTFVLINFRNSDVIYLTK